MERTSPPQRKKAKTRKRAIIWFDSSIAIDENDCYTLQRIFPHERLPELVGARCRDIGSPNQKNVLPVVEIGDETSGYRVRKLRMPNDRVKAMEEEDDCWKMTSVIALDSLETFHLETFHFDSLFDDSLLIGNWIGKLTNLKELVLCAPWDDWGTNIPETLGRMISLEKLIVKNTEFPYTWGPPGFPIQITNLTSLKELEVWYTHNVPDAIQRLTNLEILRLPYSATILIPSTVGSLARLRCLDLSHGSLVLRERIPDGLMETMLRNQAEHVIQYSLQDFPASLWPRALNRAAQSCVWLQKFHGPDESTLPSPKDLILFLVRNGADKWTRTI